MVEAAADLAQFIQRRELLAHEQRVARHSYAYGVDLRRTAWLAASSFADPIIRTVDRRWNALTEELSGSILQDERRAAPRAVMEEIARICRLLRAPLPTLRLLVRGVPRDGWPVATPIGMTKGAAHWLVLDVERLSACPSHEQSFLLGSALAHLQCDHGPIIAAHLMADRLGSGVGLVRTLLRPWTKLMWFTADRAALLAVGDLENALAALHVHADPAVSWMPSPGSVTLREQAMRDFDRSSVAIRLRVLHEREQAEATTPLGQKVDDAEAGPNPPESTQNADSEPDEHACADNGAPHPYRTAAASSEAESLGAQDDALAKALVGSWSLARCDARLTRRLGLL